MTVNAVDERVSPFAAITSEIVGIKAPDHEPAQVLLQSIIHLNANGSVVVVADPLVSDH